MNSRIPNRNRSIILGLVLLGTLALCPTATAQRFPNRNRQGPNQPPEQKPVVLHMRLDDGRVTAEIADCPMQTALQELAERTGIIFEIRSEENPLISVHLNRVPLQEAIQRIAVNSSTMFYYKQDNEESDTITLVRIFPHTKPIPQPGITYLGTGAITKSNEDVETPEQALQVLQGSKNIEAREKAIELLVRTKNDAAAKALMKYLFDPSPEIRIGVIEGLAALGAHDALPGILKSLRDAHPGVRQSATTAVALLGDARNLRDLKPLSADRDPSVAAAAETAMRKLSAAAKK